MRQVLAVVGMMVVSGCTKSNDIPPIIDPPTVVCTGDVTITTSADMDAFVARGCTEVTGGLAILGTDLTSVDLPLLRNAKSLLISENTELTSVNLPALTTLPDHMVIDLGPGWSNEIRAGLVVLGNAALVTLTLPALTTVGSLDVEGNDALSDLSLPALEVVGGYLWIRGNQILTSFNLPALTTILPPAGTWNSGYGLLSPTGLMVDYNTSLPECIALAFKDNLIAAHGYTGVWSISGNDTAATCLPVVCEGDVTITSSAEMDAFVARGCTSVTGTLSITGSDLTGVYLPVLGTVGTLAISGNPSLSGVSLPALRSVEAVGVDSGQSDCYFHNPPPMPGLAYYQSGLEICRNDVLSTIDLPLLASVASATILGNSTLTNMSLPSLSTETSSGMPCWTGSSSRYCSGGFNIVGNPSYPQCAAETLWSEVTWPNSAVKLGEVSGNDTTATCPP